MMMKGAFLIVENCTCHDAIQTFHMHCLKTFCFNFREFWIRRENQQYPRMTNVAAAQNQSLLWCQLDILKEKLQWKFSCQFRIRNFKFCDGLKKNYWPFVISFFITIYFSQYYLVSSSSSTSRIFQTNIFHKHNVIFNSINLELLKISISWIGKRIQNLYDTFAGTFVSHFYQLVSFDFNWMEIHGHVPVLKWTCCRVEHWNVFDPFWLPAYEFHLNYRNYWKFIFMLMSWFKMQFLNWFSFIYAPVFFLYFECGPRRSIEFCSNKIRNIRYTCLAFSHEFFLSTLDVCWI